MRPTKALPAQPSEGLSRRRKESPRRDWEQRADDVVRKTGGGGIWFRRWVFQEEEEVRASKEGNKMSSVTAELQLQLQPSQIGRMMLPNVYSSSSRRISKKQRLTHKASSRRWNLQVLRRGNNDS